MKLFLRNLHSKMMRKKSDNPSVLDYDSSESLKQALSYANSTTAGRTSSTRGGGDGGDGGLDTSGHSKRSISSSKTDPLSSQSSHSHSHSHSRSSRNSKRGGGLTLTSKSSSSKVEWKLENVQVETTEPQTMEQELRRLQVLQSYLLLDSDTEADFDRITSMASKVFKVPIALISLVDLGRQWFMSAQGLDAKETPRKHAFCAHVVLSTKNIMVVPDATKDARFAHNPLVTGPPNIRFYAGAALVSPEGYKLGTVCIIDDKPRNLKKSEQAILKDLSAMAMSAMVDRRARLHNQGAARAKILAHTCTDLAGSLDGVLKSLIAVERKVAPLLKEQPQTREQLKTAIAQIDLKARTCRSALRTCSASSGGGGADDLPTKASSSSSSDPEQPKRQRGMAGMSDSLTDIFEMFEKIACQDDDASYGAVTKMVDVYQNLNSIIAPLPNRVPISIELHESVPTKIVADDLLLFRSSLFLLSSSIDRTQQGEIHFRISASEEQVIFECEDTGPKVPTDQNHKKYFLQSPDPQLSSMASMVSSMGGEYGIDEGAASAAATVFWFAIPLMAAMDMTDWSCEQRMVGETLIQHHEPSATITATVAGSSKTKTKVMVDDPFQAALIQDSCLGGALEPTLRGGNHSNNSKVKLGA